MGGRAGRDQWHTTAGCLHRQRTSRSRHAYANSDGNGNGHRHGYSNADANAKTYPNTEGSRNTTATPVEFATAVRLLR